MWDLILLWNIDTQGSVYLEYQQEILHHICMIKMMEWPERTIYLGKLPSVGDLDIRHKVLHIPV